MAKSPSRECSSAKMGLNPIWKHNRIEPYSLFLYFLLLSNLFCIFFRSFFLAVQFILCMAAAASSTPSLVPSFPAPSLKSLGKRRLFSPSAGAQPAPVGGLTDSEGGPTRSGPANGADNGKRVTRSSLGGAGAGLGGGGGGGRDSDASAGASVERTRGRSLSW